MGLGANLPLNTPQVLNGQDSHSSSDGGSDEEGTALSKSARGLGSAKLRVGWETYYYHFLGTHGSSCCSATHRKVSSLLEFNRDWLSLTAFKQMEVGAQATGKGLWGSTKTFPYPAG